MNYLPSIRAAAVIILLCSLGYFMYNKVYQTGYADAEQKYTKLIQEYQTAQASKVTALEAAVRKLTDNTATYNYALIKDIDQIKATVKTKPLIIYKEGKCTIAKEFLDSRDAAITRANQR